MHWAAYPQKDQPCPFFAKPLINQKIDTDPRLLPPSLSQFVSQYFGFLQSSLGSNFSVNPIIFKIFLP